MIRRIEDFVKEWKAVSATTLGHLEALTDASLAQPVGPDDRTLGRIAWHIVQTIPEMAARTGLSPDGPGEEAPVPDRAGAIADAYRTAGHSLLEQVRERWTDETLQTQDDMYGQKWKRGATLAALLRHEIHHRGQMTVLMRQAGLRVPATFGPTREDWTAWGKEPPAV
jgi:uncharacterized damage-inducible protein DinB